MQTKGNKTFSAEVIFLIVLMIASAVLRFWDLGFSHYFGDETKTLYVDKTVPAISFLLDQRKGPVQFVAAWFMEKISGGYSEMWIRLPFAIANLLSILAFYIMVREIFGKKTAMLASVFYAFGGFIVAFGRTAQYQSFLLLFSFLAVYLFFRWEDTKARFYLILSALASSAALLSHYDALFYLLPCVLALGAAEFKQNLNDLLLYFAAPIGVLSGSFYLPYIFLGFFNSNTWGYIQRRITGSSDSMPNNSLYTYFVYNPFNIFTALVFAGFILGFVYLYKTKRYNSFKVKHLLWTLAIAFVIFELFIQSPGTHILHYTNGIFMLAAFGLVSFIEASKNLFIKRPVQFIVAVVVVLNFYVQLHVFVPYFNNGYPWVAQDLEFATLPQIKRESQLFLYGFVYNREWKTIADILASEQGIKGFYTNDNAVVAKYYVPTISFTIPGNNFYPQYFVYVYDNQELKYPDESFLSNYTLKFEVTAKNTAQKQTTASIYKLKQ